MANGRANSIASCLSGSKLVRAGVEDRWLPMVVICGNQQFDTTLGYNQRTNVHEEITPWRMHNVSWTTHQKEL
jgi:hypothetical protein